MTHSQRPVYALFLRLGAVLCIATMFMLVKLAAQNGTSIVEAMFWRQIIPLGILLSWLAARGHLYKLRTERITSHGARAIAGMFGMLCSFAAATLLPLAEATTLGFTTPLFAVIISALYFHDRVGVWRWSAVILGFIGVLIIAQPSGQPISPLGAAAGLGAGLMVAIISFQIKGLSRTEESISVVFYFSLFGTLMTAILLPAVMTPHTIEQWMNLFAIGVIGTAGQLLLTAALRHGSVASVIVMDYTALIWSTTYDWAIWSHFPPHAIWIGAPAIIGAGLLITWRESRLLKIRMQAAQTQ